MDIDFLVHFSGNQAWRHLTRPVLVGAWTDRPPPPSDVLSDWLFLLCLRGAISCHHAGEHSALRQDQALLLASDTLPCLEVHRGSRVLLLAYIGAHPLSREIRDNLASPLHFPVQSRACQNLLAFSRLRHQEQVAMTEFDGMIMIDSVLSGLIQHADRIDDARPQLVRHACQIIQKQAEKPYDAGAIADSLKVSTNHFGRVFVEVMGITPGQYHKQQRLRLAARLLKTSRLSVQEIAERLSYGTQSTMARAFRSVYGMSPQEFRDHASVPLV
ncbi:MAG: helix-turn-helix transcriptional regulator [Planctomycetota bacterium]